MGTLLGVVRERASGVSWGINQGHGALDTLYRDFIRHAVSVTYMRIIEKASARHLATV